MRWLWLAFGLICLGIGLVGTVLPLVPTVPLVLLAAYAFARSSERLHDWLVRHPRLGPPLEDWRRFGAIRRPAKRIATISVLIAFGISVLLGVRPAILAVQAIVLGGVLVFIWSRPG